MVTMLRGRMSDERVARVEQALREAEARHAKELAEERYTRSLYLLVWMERNGGPLRITQDGLRDAAEEMKAGSRLTFEVEEDGERLRISAVRDGAGLTPEKPRQLVEN